MPLVRAHEESGVLIAGGTSGIGLATAQAFLGAGVRRIVLLARDAGRGRRVAADLTAECPGSIVEFVAADATSPEQVDDAVSTARAALGAIDVLVSSVTAPYRPELLHRTPQRDLPDILAAMALPPMLLTRTVLPMMSEQGGGSVVTVASDAAKIATPGESVIGGAMAAIVMFTRVAALEAKRTGVRVNAITPSLVSGTPFTDTLTADGFSKDLFEKVARSAHLGLTEPQDVAALAVFLGGPGASKITGQTISVNGGVSAA